MECHHVKNIILIVLSLIGLSSQAAELDQLSTENAKVRAVIPGAVNTAGYLIVKNNSDKDVKLVSASSPIAERVEFHQHLHQGGLMKMIKLDDVTVPANGEVVFESGGLHIMFLGVDSTMANNKTANVRLMDSNGNELSVEFKVESIHQKIRHH